MTEPGKGSLLFDEQFKRGNKPMPAPHFSQPNTGVASDIGESLGTLDRDLGSLRVKSGNQTTDLSSGISGTTDQS